MPDISTALIIVTRAHDKSLTQTLTTYQISDTSERPNHALAMCLAAFARVFQEDTVSVAPTEDRATVRACFQKTTALLRIAARIPEEMNMGEVTGFGRREEKTKVKKRSRRDAMKHLLEVCSSCDESAVKLEEMKKVVMELDDLEMLRKTCTGFACPKAAWDPQKGRAGQEFAENDLREVGGGFTQLLAYSCHVSSRCHHHVLPPPTP